MKFLRRYQGYFGIALVTCGIGIGIGVLLPVQTPIAIASPDQHENNSSYHFINPLLSCGDSNFSRLQNGDVLSLKDAVKVYIGQEEQKGVIDQASVYFRELNGGQWFSINGDVQFVPASLLKVPLAMTVYLKSEHDPS